jgi:hypothetical protein
MRTISAPTFLQLGGDHEGGQLGEDADDQTADECAEGRAEPAERDAGEQQQQDLEAEQVADLLRQREEDPAERRERGADDPDDADDALDVDAGRRGQRRVVGDRPGRLADPGALQADAHDRQHDHRQRHDHQVAGGIEIGPSESGCCVAYCA